MSDTRSIFDIFARLEKSRRADGPVSALIVGLGNPGEKYLGTRHNAGFMALDYISGRLSADVRTSKFHALVGEAALPLTNGENARVLLMKPQTFMNLSGKAVAEAARFYKIPADRVIVLCDDISFAPGKCRVRLKGSAGGHNGLKSINECLGTQEYPRVKIGVGQKPHPDYDLADWVLGTLSADDRGAMAERFEAIYEAVRLLLSGETDEAIARVSR